MPEHPGPDYTGTNFGILSDERLVMPWNLEVSAALESSADSDLPADASLVKIRSLNRS